jgi:integration host factor subunit alpha
MGRGGAQVLKNLGISSNVELSTRRNSVTKLKSCRGAPAHAGDKFMADLGIARLNNETDANGTLTRADLADAVHRKLGLSRAESANLVERVLHHMCHSLAEGANVKISGFGTFILRDKGRRIGRNPKTGVEVPIAPRRVMTFRASQIMRDRIAKG